MRARAREVNIFNMSLLDILCGALGAFCFMMLVLLPYYKPPADADDLRQQQATTDELMKKLEKLKEQAKDSALAKQLQDLVQQLQDQIKQLQGQVNQFASENQQLKTQNDALTKKNDEQARALDQRRPFLTTVTTIPPQNVNLYVWDDSVNADKKTAAPFDPTQPRQWPSWTGDTLAWLNGTSTWLVRDSPPNIHYKVYVKLTNDPASRIVSSVDGEVVGENAKWAIELPQVTLSPERFWTLLGTMTGEPQGKVSFKPATQEERDAEWTKLSKGATPPPVPSPPGTTFPFGPAAPAGSASAARPTATAVSEEERKAMLERIERMRRERQRQQQQQATPAAATTQTP